MEGNSIIGIPNANGDTVLQLLPQTIRLHATREVLNLHMPTELYFNQKGEPMYGVGWLLHNYRHWEAVP